MAAMTFNSCAHCDDCDDLLTEIQRRMHSTESGGDKGLLTRISEQMFGCQTPANTVSTQAACAGHRMQGTWDGHNRAIKTQHGRLRDAVDDYDDNDCGDLVTDQPAAQRFMNGARAAAYAPSHEVSPGSYQGPAGLASVAADPPEPPTRTWGEWARDQAQAVCVGGLRAGGTTLGALGGGLVMGGEGLLVGAGAGTLVAPGPGTVGGGIVGTATGLTAGVIVGGGTGYLAGDQAADWLCY